MRVLILARHGESEYSAHGLCNGDPAILVALTPRGREQAANLGLELAGEPIGLCATSQFPRAQETADLALRGRTVPRIILPELNDINYGALEGETRATYHAWMREHGEDTPLPGGESRSDVAHRVSVALAMLCETSEEMILAVAHEIVLKLALNAGEGRDPAAHRDPAYATPYAMFEEGVLRAVEGLVGWKATADK
jgi:broad specificity phosphatase PhoE